MSSIDRVHDAMKHRLSPPVVFGAVSLCAVAIGAYLCSQMDVPSALWARNLAAWGVGAVAAGLIATTLRPSILYVALWAAPLGLLATFASPAQEGVHRWFDVGLLHVNAAMALLPAMVVSFAMLARTHLWAWLAPFASLALLVLQPDASQATTLAFVMISLTGLLPLQPIARFAVIAGAAALAAISWFQPDPLQPVPEVEDILSAGFMISPIAAGFALILLSSTALCLDAPARYMPPPQRAAAWALSACFIGWSVTPFLGAFPVPWIGIGLSPIIGAWLGVGLLAGVGAKAS